MDTKLLLFVALTAAKPLALIAFQSGSAVCINLRVLTAWNKARPTKVSMVGLYIWFPRAFEEVDRILER